MERGHLSLGQRAPDRCSYEHARPEQVPEHLRRRELGPQAVQHGPHLPAAAQGGADAAPALPPHALAATLLFGLDLPDELVDDGGVEGGPGHVVGLLPGPGPAAGGS